MKAVKGKEHAMVNSAEASGEGAIRPSDGQTVWRRASAIAGLAAFVFAGLIGPAISADAPPRFWNLTPQTIVDFRLAPAGTTNFGINQCVNDKDGAVDNDERLRLTGVAAGVYDARLVDKAGRVCHARGLKIEPGVIFSLEERDLVDCDK